VHAGLATHYVLRENFPALRAALVESGDTGVVERFTAPLPEASFAPHRAAMDRCFGQDSVLGIIAALEAEGTEWAAAQVKILRRMSPTSLSVSLELLRRGAAMNLRQCLDEELKLTRTVVHDHPDFREGVRSVLVDKDGTPNWMPASLEAVDRAEILRLFN
jgi:enoyl-CoA hydratase/carnithine racemase